MSESPIMDAYTALTFADKSDPVIASLCLHLSEVLDELTETKLELTETKLMITLIKQQLAEFGLEVEINIGTSQPPEG